MSSFVVLIATMALVFSRIEGWQFLDGCYFTITTITTVGFGDFRPTKTSTKVLLFPFAVLGIALLANQVSLIVGYFGKQSELRRTKWRAQRMALAKESREKDLKDSDRWGLVEEMKVCPSALLDWNEWVHRTLTRPNLLFVSISSGCRRRRKRSVRCTTW